MFVGVYICMFVCIYIFIYVFYLNLYLYSASSVLTLFNVCRCLYVLFILI